jgi:hypothetical protein
MSGTYLIYLTTGAQENGTWSADTANPCATGAGEANGSPAGLGYRDLKSSYTYKARLAGQAQDEEGGLWAGYVAESATECDFTGVTGRWTQPKITCPETNEGTEEVDFWVGLDGDSDLKSSNTVEQTGVEAQCVWNTGGGQYAISYRAWYEMYPNDAVYFNGLHPEPGSTVEATVAYNDKDRTDSYDLTLAVTTGGKEQSEETNQPCDAGRICRNITAEWVAEKVPAYDLAAFYHWALDDGYATTSKNPIDQTIASLKPVKSEATPKTGLSAYSCSLNKDGSSFIVQQAPC